MPDRSMKAPTSTSIEEGSQESLKSSGRRNTPSSAWYTVGSGQSRRGRPMRRVLWSLVLATLTLAVSGALLLGAIWQGAVQPPVGMVWLGPVALSAHRDCI